MQAAVAGDCGAEFEPNNVTTASVGGVTAGQARHISSNVGVVTAGQVGHNSS